MSSKQNAELAAKHVMGYERLLFVTLDAYTSGAKLMNAKVAEEAAEHGVTIKQVQNATC